MVSGNEWIVKIVALLFIAIVLHTELANTYVNVYLSKKLNFTILSKYT